MIFFPSELSDHTNQKLFLGEAQFSADRETARQTVESTQIDAWRDQNYFRWVDPMLEGKTVPHRARNHNQIVRKPTVGDPMFYWSGDMPCPKNGWTFSG